MKGNYSGFGGSGGSGNAGNDSGDDPKNGKDYNTAGSSSVGQVDSVQTVSEVRRMPMSSSPNSVIRNYRNGSLYIERYYGSDGKPYLDIDYSDHGNPNTHPDVPHQHTITFINGVMDRQKTNGRIQ